MAFDRETDFPQIKYLFSILSHPDRTIRFYKARDWLKKQSTERNPLQILRKQLPELGNLYKDDSSLLGYLLESSNRKNVFNKLTLSSEQRAQLGRVLQFGETAEQPELTQSANQGVSTAQVNAEETLPVAPTPTPGGNPPSLPMARGGFQSSQPPRRVVMQSQLESKANMAGKTEVPDPTLKPPLEPAQTMSSPANKPPIQTIPATNEQPLRFQSGWRSSLKTGLSNAGIFTRENGGKIINGLRGMAGGVTGGMVRSGGNMLASGLNGNFPGRVSFTNRIGNLRRVTAGGQGQLVKIGRGRGKLFFIGIFSLMFLTGIIAAISNPGGEQPIAIAGPTTGTGDILSCKFTRAGNPQSIKNLTLIGWINIAASAAGIPPQVLASVAMHESQDFVSTASDTKYQDEIKNNKYCNYGAVMCINKDNTGTLYPDDGKDHPCTPTDIAGGARTARAVGLMQNIDIYNPSKDLCSITESLAIAAAKLKANGLTAQPTQDQVNSAIKSYYNSCTYGSYSYCNEVWQDLQKCQANQTQAVASCPVINGKISTPSYDASPTNGHCSPGYLLEGRCRTDCPGGVGGSRRAKAIDVPTNGQDVKLPMINNQSVNWLLKLNYQVAPVDGGGNGYVFEAQTSSGVWTLDILHLAGTGLELNKNYPSDTKVGKSNIDHVHFTLGKDIKDNMNPGPATTATDCDPGWLPSDFMCK